MGFRVLIRVPGFRQGFGQAFGCFDVYVDGLDSLEPIMGTSRRTLNSSRLALQDRSLSALPCAKDPSELRLPSQPEELYLT